MDKNIKNEIKYSSTQFDLNVEDANQIREFVKTFINEEDIIELEENYHITIKFGLHDEVPDKLIDLLSTNNVKPVTVMLGKTSIFNSSEEQDVLKIDINSGELRKLNKLISSSLEVTDTFPVYSPHLTLAYLIKGSGQKYIGDATFEDKLITFDKLTFSPSSEINNLDDTFISLL